MKVVILAGGLGTRLAEETPLDESSSRLQVISKNLSMSIIKKNLAANFVGNGWTALMAVVLIPLYIKFLGIEAWGLIGIFASLQAICLLLDMGLSTTLNREMARLRFAV